MVAYGRYSTVAAPFFWCISCNAAASLSPPLFLSNSLFIPFMRLYLCLPESDEYNFPSFSFIVIYSSINIFFSFA